MKKEDARKFKTEMQEMFGDRQYVFVSKEKPIKRLEGLRSSQGHCLEVVAEISDKRFQRAKDPKAREAKIQELIKEKTPDQLKLSFALWSQRLRSSGITCIERT